VFYHARITCKAARAKKSPLVGYENDLSREDLLEKIAKPFIRRDQFFCGGAVIFFDKVAEFRFSETQQSAEELAPLIYARRRMNRVLSLIPAKHEVVSEGPGCHSRDHR